MSKEEILSKLESIAKNNAVAIKLSIAVLTCMNVIVCGLIYNTLINTTAEKAEMEAHKHLPNIPVMVQDDRDKGIEEFILSDADEDIARKYLDGATEISESTIENTELERVAKEHFSNIKKVFANETEYLVMGQDNNCLTSMDGYIYIDGAPTGERIFENTHGIGADKYNEALDSNLQGRRVKISTKQEAE